jgi:hypothetical protein
MEDDQDVADICRLLRAADLEPERVPEAEGQGCKRCDLRVVTAQEQYLIEIKSFHDDATINQTLKSGTVYECTHSKVYRDQVAKQVRDAVRQLQSTPREHPDNLGLVALIARSKIDSSFMTEQIIGTLYGVAAIIDDTDVGADNAGQLRRCLYFNDSVFHRHPELDGALVLDDAENVCFLMNDHGHQLDRLRRGKLACFLAQHNALYDAPTWEKRGELVADFEVDRADGEAVLARLREKYRDRKLHLTNMVHWEGIAVIPLK